MKVDYGNVYQIWIIHKSGKSTFYLQGHTFEILLITCLIDHNHNYAS